jgi:hypothetical protein
MPGGSPTLPQRRSPLSGFDVFIGFSHAVALGDGLTGAVANSSKVAGSRAEPDTNKRMVAHAAPNRVRQAGAKENEHPHHGRVRRAAITLRASDLACTASCARQRGA